MEVTSVRVSLCRPNPDLAIRLCAFVSVTLDGVLVVRHMKLMYGPPKGGGTPRFFVAMPARRNENAKPNDRYAHIDTVYPAVRELREEIHQHVLEAYARAIGDTPHGLTPEALEELARADPRSSPRSPEPATGHARG